jgi:hypothetical protein
MKHNISNFIAMGLLGVGLTNVSTLIVRYFPAVAEAFYFLTTLLLGLILLAILAGIVSHTMTGSHEFMIKILAVVVPLALIAAIGVTLGVLN